MIASLATDPRVVVFDEATAALPAEETRWVLELARRLAAEGKLVLFISHRLPEIRRVADAVTVLRDGDAVLHAPTASRRREHRRGDAGPQAAAAATRRRWRRRARASSSRVRGPLGRARLRDVSFELREGEIVGVGGLQGQGQSALLYALFGLVAARAARSACRDQRVRIRSPRAAFNAGIGLALVPEDRRHEGLIMSQVGARERRAADPRRG